MGPTGVGRGARRRLNFGGEEGNSSSSETPPPPHRGDRMSSHGAEPPVWIKGLAVLGALSLLWTVGKGLWNRFFKRS